MKKDEVISSGSCDPKNLIGGAQSMKKCRKSMVIGDGANWAELDYDVMVEERRKFNAVGRARGDIVKPDVVVDPKASLAEMAPYISQDGQTSTQVLPGQNWRWEFEYAERRKFGTIYIMVLVKRPLEWREDMGEDATNELNRQYNKLVVNDVNKVTGCAAAQ